MSRPSADSTALFMAIFEQDRRSKAAFRVLLSPPADIGARREAHRAYREATRQLLDLERRHNQEGAPKPWNLELIAQPLVQQTMIEADLLDALGRRGEAGGLREDALKIAKGYLGSDQLGRLMRERAMLLSQDGRFNEALTQLDDVRRQFMEDRNAVQAAQTALEQASVLEWLGDEERALAVIGEARRLTDSRLGGRRWGVDEIAASLSRDMASIEAGHGATGASDQAAALWRISLELVEHEARARKAMGELDEAQRLFSSVLGDYAGLGEAGVGIEYQLAPFSAVRDLYLSPLWPGWLDCE
jgi:tetratricopeptide (TPR) repeat protein